MGWTALKLISISTQVSSGPSPAVIKPSSGASNNNFIEQQQPSPPHSFYNSHIFENEQMPPPQFRIPYEYILYHKWHQQQQQMLQHQQQAGGGLMDSHYRNSDSQQLYNQRPYYEGAFSWHQQQPRRLPPSQFDHDESLGLNPFTGRVPGESYSRQTTPSLVERGSLPHHRYGNSGGVDELTEEDDERSKVFRSVLLQRKNFKGLPPVPELAEPLGDLPSDEVSPGIASRDEDTLRESINQSGISQRPEEQQPGKVIRTIHGKIEQVSRDLSTSSFSPLESESESEQGDISSAVPMQRTKPVEERRQLRQRRNKESKAVGEEGTSGGEHPPPQTMMLMMTKAQDNSQRDGTGYYGGVGGRRGTSLKRLTPDFKAKYAKTLLICGLLGLCTVVFQFLTSFLLLCFLDKVRYTIFLENDAVHGSRFPGVVCSKEDFLQASGLLPTHLP